MAFRARHLWTELELAVAGRCCRDRPGEPRYRDRIDRRGNGLGRRALEIVEGARSSVRFPGLDVAGPVCSSPIPASWRLTTAPRAPRLRPRRSTDGVRVTSLLQATGRCRSTLLTATSSEPTSSSTAPAPRRSRSPRPEQTELDSWPLRLAAPSGLLPNRQRRTDAYGLPVSIEWGPDMIYGLAAPATSVRSPHARRTRSPAETPGRPPLGPFDPRIEQTTWQGDAALVALLTSAVARLFPASVPTRSPRNAASTTTRASPTS